MTEDPSRPRLAPPGAGVPAIERLVGGAFLRVRRQLGTPAGFSAHFQREQRAMARLYSGWDAGSLGTRVLIPRLRGLEDSSRYWSVWMTLDHLRIVNDSISGVIGELVRGRVPEERASTAAVKPSERAGVDAVAAYELSCARLLALVASQPRLRTEARYAHPWFGPLDALGWHAMSAMHMTIHRAQIERILRGLPRTRP